MWFVIYGIIILTGGFLIYAYIMTPDDAQTVEEIDRETMKGIAKKYTFSEDRIFLSKDNYNGLVLDTEGRNIHYIYTTSSKEDMENEIPREYGVKNISFDDILKSEVVVDDNVLIQTRRGSQLGGAAVGGVLLGGVGAVIGGLSGKKKETSTINTMELVITLNDLENPICHVYFLNSEDYINYRYTQTIHKADSEQVKEATKAIEKWQSTIDVILHQNS